MFLLRALFVGATALHLTLLASGGSLADRRPYLATYGYYTPFKGEVELEQWTDVFIDRDGGSAYRSRTEIEYGVTSRLAAGLYFVNRKPDGGNWEYHETKLELRYRLTEQGKRFLDTAGYLEIIRPNDSDEPYEIEAKAIFSHEFPKFNVTLNLIGEKEMVSGAELEKGYAIGLSPHWIGRPIYSIELFGSGRKHYILPAFWFSPGFRQNAGIGLAVGLTDDSDRFQIRTIYTHEF